jgi:phosphatidylserine decarboxylase
MDGYKFAAVPLALAVVALVLHWNWLAVIFFVLTAFVLYFFRDPQRTPPADADAIVSPADGRVMEIVDEEFAGKPGKRLSIFLSIFDVHVNRSPVAGRVSGIEYRTGKFYAAMRGRASAENEQNVIQVVSERGEIVFKQIAGWLARRILCWKAVGDGVTRGERIGMIRFGSRVDVWFPPNVEITARSGQHVAGGSSILARWR